MKVIDLDNTKIVFFWFFLIHPESMQRIKLKSFPVTDLTFFSQEPFFLPSLTSRKRKRFGPLGFGYCWLGKLLIK